MPEADRTEYRHTGEPITKPPAGPAEVDAAGEAHLRPAVPLPDRMERTVGALLLVGALAFVAFAALFSAAVGSSTQLLGVALGVGFVAFGVALVAWGKYLAPRGPFVQQRHVLASRKAEREAVLAGLSRGQAGVGRRGFLFKLAGLAGAAATAALLFPLRSLGPQPKKMLFRTDWRPGSPLVGADGRPVLVDELDVGGVKTVFPGEIFSNGAPTDTQLQVDQTLLIRVSTDQPVVTRPGRETWSVAGYLAYSKVCTHAGCPVGLYEQATHQLLCPCHQSIFDVLTGATPVFGPAPRPLPQLPLAVDDNGYLLAQAGYDEPIGPGFWERA